MQATATPTRQRDPAAEAQHRLDNMEHVFSRPHIKELIGIATEYSLTFQIRIRLAPEGRMQVHFGLDD